MSAKRLVYLAICALVLSAASATTASACSTVCVGGKNSDGTVTVCRNQGGGTWKCNNVPASKAPVEE